MLSYCRHNHQHPKNQEPAVRIKDLSAAYPGNEPEVLKNVSLDIPVGACLALVGANGAGKSSLFKAICGFIPVTSGSIDIFGHALKACHHRVVYLPQRTDIDWMFPMSVLDLVLTGRYVYLGWFKRPSSEDVKIAQDALDKLEVGNLAGRQIHALSGGQQQRVLIARALAQNADLLLLDEPLNAVDAATRAIVADVLRHLKKNGKTVVVATHYVDEAEHLYDGAVFLKDGQLVSIASPIHGDGCHHD